MLIKARPHWEDQVMGNKKKNRSVFGRINVWPLLNGKICYRGYSHIT
jgi:hypothetical protein